MKKIVFLEDSLNAGGAERVFCNLMNALNKNDFEIHLVLVCELGELGHLVPKHVKIHELKVGKTRNALLEFRKIVKNINPDIIFTSRHHTSILSKIATSFIDVLRIARYPSMPSIEKKEGRLKGDLFFLMKMLYRKFNKIIAQTEEMSLELQEFYKIDQSKIKVIMNPVDTKHIDESVKNAKNPFENGKINVVASGRMGIEKGFDILIESFAKVVEKRGDFHLNILGRDVDGNLEKLEKQVAELGISENVTFHGFQKNPYPFYKFCDLFVLSSRREGLPNVVLECQYLGKPVVATRCIPVIERLIDNGRNGFVVDVEDVDGLAEAILKYKELKGEKIYRDSIGDFVDLFKGQTE